MAKNSLAQGADPTNAIKERPEVEATSEELLREKSKSPLFKLISVFVYVGAVTGNGFLVSVFFLFIWDPQIQVERPSHMAPDGGLLEKWSPHGPARLVSERLIADDEGIHAQPLKNPAPPKVPYHRIMSNEFTNDYINKFHGNIVPGSKPEMPELPPNAIPSKEQEEYGNNGSTVSNIGSEEGNESTSSSNGGPSTARQQMTKEQMTGGSSIASPGSHQRPSASKA